MVIIKFFVLVLVIFLVSCVANPTYVRPIENSHKIQNNIIIEKNYDAVWSALIEYSSKSFFAIKNFEKESGLLTLSFGAGDPAKFVNCGEINAPSIRFKGPYLNAIESTGSANLDGVMNLFVKPIKSDRTLVSVNARYILNVKDGRLPRQTWSFDSSGEKTRKTGIVNVTCKPTLEAEMDILNGIKLIATN